MVERAARRENNPNAAVEPPLRAVNVPTTSIDDLHELRVRIPVDLHRQLLSLKVLRGKSLAETVSLALDRYFTEVRAPAPNEKGDATGR